VKKGVGKRTNLTYPWETCLPDEEGWIALGDGNGNRFADLNRVEDVDGLQRRSNGKVDPEGTFAEEYRFTDWSMKEDLESRRREG
jgi:hypothetical protein